MIVSLMTIAFLGSTLDLVVFIESHHPGEESLKMDDRLGPFSASAFELDCVAQDGRLDWLRHGAL